MYRSAVLLVMFLCAGCASSGVGRRVSTILDDWRDPLGVARSADVAQPVGEIPGDLRPSSFPLPWPDLEAWHEAERLVRIHGSDQVRIALEREYHISSPPRNVRALCLMSLNDDSDDWIELWLADHPFPSFEQAPPFVLDEVLQ